MDRHADSIPPDEAVWRERFARGTNEQASDALDYFWTAYSPRVNARFDWLLDDFHLREDAVVIAFHKAFKSRKRFDPSREFWPWISKIAHNVCIDVLRKLPIEAIADQTDVPCRSTDDTAIVRDYMQAWRSQLTATEKVHVDALRNGIRIVEIAESEGTRAWTARTHIRNAEIKLRQFITGVNNA